MLIALVLFGTFVYFSMKQGLAKSIDDFLSMSTSQASAAINIENGIINLSDSLPESSTASLQERGLTIRILTTNGKVNQAAGPYQNLPVDPKSIQNASTGISGFSTVYTTNADAIRVYTAPITDNQFILGVIQMMQSLAGLYETLNRLMLVLLISIPILLIISALSGYFLAARALAPIDQITQTAQKISTEDLSARLNLQDNEDEIGRLARTFDGMLERLEQGFKRERQFTSDASHELRTPLAAMQAILNVTRERKRTTEEYEVAMDDLSEETDRLHTLTEDLLYIARGDVRPVSPHEVVNLSNMLVDVCESLYPIAEARKLQIRHEIQEDLWINGDSDALIRAFVNLIDNAIKYTDAGEIRVQAKKDLRQNIEVTVSDKGRGIPPDHLPYIFERFYRGDESRTTHGFGLGLAIVREIAIAHSGKIEVSSQVGSGTKFTLHFPGIRQK
jgi:heavy metal sensor kinase